MEVEKLQEQINIVRIARHKAQQASEAKNKAKAEWETQNKSLLDEATQTAQLVTEAEDTLRILALQAYTVTGNKQPAPGVSVRVLTKLEYNPKEALKWAMSHQIALSLDKKSFEGFAKATPLDFVTIREEPQATIASDLEKLYPAPEG